MAFPEPKNWAGFNTAGGGIRDHDGTLAWTLSDSYVAQRRERIRNSDAEVFLDTELLFIWKDTPKQSWFQVYMHRDAEGSQ